MLPSDFLAGVVEGFYGQCWTHHERLDLVDQLARLGLNTYFYAPKNDLKHRAIWREPYSDSELAQFRDLVQKCDRYGVNFIYGLSPGLDICFSDENERNRIKSRFDQMRTVGVQHFALLFDDLPGKLSDEDRTAYESLAAAQCDAANAVFSWVRDRSASARFLFCPTPYCDRMDDAQLGGANYLDETGRLLSPQIDVLWTGPDIVSATIPVESIERLSRRLRRSPVIWDNLFANDYDFRRLHCGPYSGRSRDLRRAVRGILINPNNEYPINFIPLRSFAAHLLGDGEWNPREAFLDIAREWQSCFETVTEPLALADLILLSDCFYLPHTAGPDAEKLLALVDRLLAEPAGAGRDAREEFSVLNARVQTLFDRITELRDRELFDAWSRRIWELKEQLLLVEAFLACQQAGRDSFATNEPNNSLPVTIRGGILANLERAISLDPRSKLRPRSTP